MKTAGLDHPFISFEFSLERLSPETLENLASCRAKCDEITAALQTLPLEFYL